MSKTGRNELCHCGSGKKFKKCHGVASPVNRSNLMLMIVGAGMLAAVIVGIISFTGERATGPSRVWSAEHGHYHDASGTEVP